MAEPIEFQIVQDVQAALRGISVGEGYHYDVRGTAVKLNPDHDVEALVADDAPRPFVVIEVTPEAFAYQPSQRVRLDMPVRVHWFNESQPEVDEDMVRMFFRGCADIEQAVAVDLTRGGRAIDTRIVRRTNSRDVEGAAVWAMVDLNIALIRTYGEPNA